jgi:hypothetical protein
MGMDKGKRDRTHLKQPQKGYGGGGVKDEYDRGGGREEQVEDEEDEEEDEPCAVRLDLSAFKHF